MAPHDTTNCAALCKKEDEDGCCYIDNKSGCWWYPGGRAYSDGVPVPGRPGLISTTVTCNHHPGGGGYYHTFSYANDY